MSLKQNLKLTSKSKKIALITAVSLILIIAVIIVVCFVNSKHKQEYESQLQQQQLELEEERIQKQKDSQAAKEKYIKLCNDYNKEAEIYNVSVSAFNIFLERAEKYEIFDNATKLPEKSMLEMDFETFEKNGYPFSELETSMSNLSENSQNIENKHQELLVLLYNSLIDEFNTLAQDYRELMNNTSVAFVNSIPTAANEKSKINKADIELSDEEVIFSKADTIYEQISKLAENYIISNQITAPEESWIIDRLETIKDITGIEAVTKEHDPNHLLNVDGGYKSCIYFIVDQIDQNTVSGNSIIEKGTDAGGAIEIYPDLKSAENRCDYLSGFDNTLLYSGSYVLVGTMVVRTSYKLTDDEQINLTNEIITAFTEIKQS